jgi:aldehyde dehydrogenase (NAD+)
VQTGPTGVDDSVTVTVGAKEGSVTSTQDRTAAPDGLEGLAGLADRLRSTYAGGRTRPVEWRREQLRALGRMIREQEDDLLAALAADLGKPHFEAWLTDLRATGREIEHLEKHVASWVRPQGQKVPLLLRPDTASVVHEPLGAVLVIAPWNYPVHLLLTPLAAALAAGNTVCCKPSEVAPATSAAMARLLPDYLDPEAVVVVEGGVPETTALLDQRWDHILYTGNGAVGRIVAAAAARHLTPVTLELGGKSPAIVDKDANLRLAAGRIAFAKWTNAGQTCVSVDHVYVHRDVEDELVELLAQEVRNRFGKDPRQSTDFGRIVNTGHALRLSQLIDAGGFEVVVGGDADEAERYVAPTLLRDVSPDAPIMQEEIFGPILPVLAVDDVDEAIARVNAGDKPLALYVFGEENADKVLEQTSSGGACVNDAMVHIGVNALPFGGVGESGYGAYHGRWGFETFSHRKAVLRRPSWMADPPILRPPYSGWKQAVVRRLF